MERMRREQRQIFLKAAQKEAERLLKSLVARRLATDLSQATVARRMGLPQPAVARLEAGKHSPTLLTLCGYAAAIGAELTVG